MQDPFANISVEELTSAAAEFAREHGLAEHAAEFTKGALLCKGPPQPEYFLREELQVLDDELNRKWHLPRGLWLTVIVCSVGAAVQGWDQVSILYGSIIPSLALLTHDRLAVTVRTFHSPKSSVLEATVATTDFSWDSSMQPL